MEIYQKKIDYCLIGAVCVLFVLLFFTTSGCALRGLGRVPDVNAGESEKKAPSEEKPAPVDTPPPVAVKKGSPLKSQEKTVSIIKEPSGDAVASPPHIKKEPPALPLETPAVKKKPEAEPVMALKTTGQPGEVAQKAPPEATKKKGESANRFKTREIRVLDIALTTLEDCLACGKSVKELREMGLSEEEIKKAVREKLDRLNKISEERRKEYDKKKEVDFSNIKDCVACGKTGKDLKAMGFTPVQIREAYKQKFMKLKEQRERNLKSKKGQRLSEKIKEAYSRQKKNMAKQLKAEKEFISLLEENLKGLREIAPPPDPTTFPVPPEGMAFVPAGEFLMGVEWGDDTGSMPARVVNVDSFFIDRKEVAVAPYKAFMKKRLRGRIPFYLRDKYMGGESQPAFKVSWQEANDFCEAQDKRLPTEAEWEKSARGWDNRLFPWGNELPEKDGKYKANFNPGRKFEDGFLYTADTGSFPEGASPYGVLDLAGNVWEWTADWYDVDYYKTGPTDNPKGPSDGKEKVMRGGGYNTPLKRLLLTTRLKERPNMKRGYLGFRCARSAQ